MPTATLDKNKLASMLKSIFAEPLEEQWALVQDIVEEALKEIALSRAINQGLRGRKIARNTISKILKGKW